jgi:hypothetical protein
VPVRKLSLVSADQRQELCSDISQYVFFVKNRWRIIHVVIPICVFADGLRPRWDKEETGFGKNAIHKNSILGAVTFRL